MTKYRRDDLATCFKAEKTAPQPEVKVLIINGKLISLLSNLVWHQECYREACNTRITTLIRVTIQDGDADVLFLKVEGKLVEPWTAELETAWQKLSPCLKKVRLDISGLTFIDRTGTRILKSIAMATHADIQADSPLTRYFAKEILDSSYKQEG